MPTERILLVVNPLSGKGVVSQPRFCFLLLLFSIFLGEAEKGSIVTGEVTDVDAKGAVIKLNEEVDGYIKVADLSRDRVEDARSVLSVGDKIDAKIVAVDRKSRSIGLSIKAKDMDDEKEAVASLKAQDNTASPGTIGDLIKAQMSGK